MKFNIIMVEKGKGTEIFEKLSASENLNSQVGGGAPENSSITLSANDIVLDENELSSIETIAENVSGNIQSGVKQKLFLKVIIEGIILSESSNEIGFLEESWESIKSNFGELDFKSVGGKFWVPLRDSVKENGKKQLPKLGTSVGKDMLPSALKLGSSGMKTVFQKKETVGKEVGVVKAMNSLEVSIEEVVNIEKWAFSFKSGEESDENYKDIIISTMSSEEQTFLSLYKSVYVISFNKKIGAEGNGKFTLVLGEQIIKDNTAANEKFKTNIKTKVYQDKLSQLWRKSFSTEEIKTK